MWWQSLIAGPSFKSIHSWTVGRVSSSSAWPSISWSRKILASGAQSVDLRNRTTSATLHSKGLLSSCSFSATSIFISFGEGGLFSSSEKEKVLSFLFLLSWSWVREWDSSLCVGEDDSDFFSDTSDSSSSSSCCSDVLSSVRDSSSTSSWSSSSSPPLPVFSLCQDGAVLWTLIQHHLRAKEVRTTFQFDACFPAEICHPICCPHNFHSCTVALPFVLGF